MPTELQIAQGFQTLFQAMTEFTPDDVVINDGSILDGSILNCPYINILTSEEIDLTPAPARNVGTYTIPVMLVERYTKEKETYDNLRDTRQAIVDEVFTGVGMSANGLEGTLVRRIRNLTGIEPISYADDPEQTFPVYIFQIYGVEVELF